MKTGKISDFEYELLRKFTNKNKANLLMEELHGKSTKAFWHNI